VSEYTGPERRRGNRWLKRIAIAWMVAVTIVVIWTAGENRKRTQEAHDLAIQIQTQRADAIRSNCRDQNARHDDTIHALDTVLAKYLKTATPQQAAQLRGVRSQNVLLINALAPKRNCETLVKQQTEGP